jgi:ribonuclease HI
MLPSLPKVKIISSEKTPKIYPELEYKLQFDGCSKSNPGVAGAGAVIYKYNKEISTKIQFVGNNSTNNMAEYTGLLIGIKEAINLGIKELSVEGDSLLVINQMNGVYKVKSENLMEIHNEVKELIKQFNYISFTHIYRTNNKRADELSNIAVSNEYLDKDIL